MTDPQFAANTDDEFITRGSYRAFDQEVSGVEVGVIPADRGLNSADGLLYTSHLFDVQMRGSGMVFVC